MGNPSKPLTQVGTVNTNALFPIDKYDDSVAGAERRAAVNDVGDQSFWEVIYARWDNATRYYSNTMRHRVAHIDPSTGVRTVYGYWYVFSVGQKDATGMYIALSTTSQYIPVEHDDINPAHLVRTAFDQPGVTYGPNWPQDT